MDFLTGTKTPHKRRHLLYILRASLNSGVQLLLLLHQFQGRHDNNDGDVWREKRYDQFF